MIQSLKLISARRVLLASTVAVAWMLANPLLPAGFDAGSPTLGAAFARHGADDGPNDNGHHAGNDDHGGRHGRHHDDDSNDDRGGRHGRHHDDSRDDHPGKHQNRDRDRNRN